MGATEVATGVAGTGVVTVASTSVGITVGVGGTSGTGVGVGTGVGTETGTTAGSTTGGAVAAAEDDGVGTLALVGAGGTASLVEFELERPIQKKKKRN